MGLHHADLWSGGAFDLPAVASFGRAEVRKRISAVVRKHRLQPCDIKPRGSPVRDIQKG